MTCRLYQEELSSYIDGELPAARAARLEAHLKECPHCRAELAALDGIGSHLRAASIHLEVSHDFDRRVLRSVGYWRVTGLQRPQPTHLKALLIVATILFAMMCAAWHFCSLPFRPPGPEPQPSAAAVAPATPAAPAPVAPDASRR